MKTRLEIANSLIQAQSKLLAHCYKVDTTNYSEREIQRFVRLEKKLEEAKIAYNTAVCTCNDGVIGKRYCIIHPKTESQ